MNKGVERLKKKDHLMLASFILSLAGSSVLSLHSAAFTAGCIEPDLNVFTYLRGSRKEKKFHGHNAGNCRAHLEKLLGKIEERGLTSGYGCFLLGVAVHYIADSFTAVHNTDILDVDVKTHLEYENRLHEELMRALSKPFIFEQDMLNTSLKDYVNDNHHVYSASAPSTKNDCSYIVKTCCSVTLGAIVLSQGVVSPLRYAAV